MRKLIRRTPKAPEIGALETRVLSLVWQAKEPINTQFLHEALVQDSVSLSNVQTTLKRLHRKGLLSRERIGHAFYYKAAVTREDLISRMIEDVSLRLAEGNLEPVISGFFDLIDRTDPALRSRLTADRKRNRD